MIGECQYRLPTAWGDGKRVHLALGARQGPFVLVIGMMHELLPRGLLKSGTWALCLPLYARQGHEAKRGMAQVACTGVNRWAGMTYI